MVSVSLHKQMDRKKRSGWIRSDAFDIEESHAQLLELNRKVQELELENRKLSEELSVYQKDKNDRLPKLAVSINVDTMDDEYGEMCYSDCAIQDEDSFIKGIKLLNVSVYEKVKEYYRPIKREDFPGDLERFAKQNEIDEYNNSLPSDEELKKYASELEEYLQNTRGCVHINIGVHNDGNLKACNASAEIEFPDGVAVFDDEILDFAEPSAPRKGKDPIKLAEKRKDDQYRFALDIPNSLASYTVPDITNITGRDWANVIAKRNNDYILYNQTIDIDCGTIIHTRSYWRRGIFLVGKKPGKYQIKCTLMCEEYTEPQIEFIDFEVQ